MAVFCLIVFLVASTISFNTSLFIHFYMFLMIFSILIVIFNFFVFFNNYIFILIIICNVGSCREHTMIVLVLMCHCFLAVCLYKKA